MVNNWRTADVDYFFEKVRWEEEMGIWTEAREGHEKILVLDVRGLSIF